MQSACCRRNPQSYGDVGAFLPAFLDRNSRADIHTDPGSSYHDAGVRPYAAGCVSLSVDTGG